MPLLEPNNMRFEDYEIDRGLWLLRWREEPIPLSRKTFDLLLYLLDHAPRVVGKDELLRELWPGSFIEESNLTQQIFLLRKSLSRHVSGAKIIETVTGRGYRIAVPVHAVVSRPSTRPHSEFTVSRQESITRISLEEEFDDDSALVPAVVRSSTRRPWVVAATVAAIVAAALAVAAGGWFGWQRWQNHLGGPPVQVVLSDFEGGTGDAVLDRTLADAVSMDLAQSPFVNVVSAAKVSTTLSEMMHKPDDSLTPALSREVCERTDSQAVLQGSVARSGAHYLLTLSALNCVDGSLIGAAKQEAVTREEIPHRIDLLATEIRQKLGESRRTITRFNAPLLAVNAGSVEALEAYSGGVHFGRQGKFPESFVLLKQALAFDPNFAAGHLMMSNLYANVNDPTNERAEMQRAYDLRDTGDMPTRLFINARYHMLVTRDIFETIRDYRSWTDLYPQAPIAWANLSEAYALIGRHRDAVSVLNRAMLLAPDAEGIWFRVCSEQMHAGDIAAARATCEQALARGIDSDDIRMALLDLGMLQHDRPLVEAQITWSKAHPEASQIHNRRLQYDLAQGKLDDARRLLANLQEEYRAQGLPHSAVSVTQQAARTFAELGQLDEARRMLHTGPPELEDKDQLIGLVETGDSAAAEAFMRDELARFPQATLWNDVYDPQIRAVIALSAHKPQDAITSLEASRNFESSTFDIANWRGQAYLDSGQPALAEAEFHHILEHQEIDPPSLSYTLAHLALARALSKEGKPAPARIQYQQFLDIMKDGDSSIPQVSAAKLELAQLKQ